MTAVNSPEGVASAPASQGWRRPGLMRLAMLALALLAVVAVVGFGVRWLLVGRFMEATNDAYLKADAMVVAPRVSGYVAEVLVAANQDVEPGQLLVRIEDGTYRAQLARAQAQLGSAAAAIKSLEAQVAHQKSVLQQAAGAATLSAARSDYAEREAGRFGHLATSGAVSGQQVDQSRTLSDQGHAELASAQAAVTSASRAVDVLTAQIGEAESAREAAKAGLLAAQLA
jgi:membrane fusion protein (multidrug efflux system)